jgi:hypothetical protein
LIENGVVAEGAAGFRMRRSALDCIDADEVAEKAGGGTLRLPP